MFKKSKNRSLFSQDCRLKYFFYFNWKHFQLFKIAQFEFKVTVIYGLWEHTQLLTPLHTRVSKSSMQIIQFGEWITESMILRGIQFSK